MTYLKITPTKLTGKVQVPPSKSLAHRAIIAASLAKGISRIDNIEYSKDIQATIKAMEALGTKIDKYDDYLIIDGSLTYSQNQCLIDCEESGSTLRFMVPISIVKENQVHFVGRGNLGKRPLQTYYDIFDKQNIDYSFKENVLDLLINGKLKPGTFEIPGNISSQFITGLLYALPLLQGDSTIMITSPLESKGYIDLTLQILAIYGIDIVNENYQCFKIKGFQQYRIHDYRVEADFSQAAFFLVAGALGNDVTLLDLNWQSLQGDKVIFDYLKLMNVSIQEVDDGIKAVKKGKLKAIDVDAGDCPDIIPILTAALALADGKSTVNNAIRLRIKECDRLEATSSQLNLLGANIIADDNSMEINGINEFTGGNLKTYNDHRIAMMIAIVATVANQPIIIDNMECVAKSYPSFWEDYQSLGGIIDVIDVEK